MKRILVLMLLIGLLAGCSHPAELVVGEYATDQFRDKYYTYLGLYDQVFFSPEGLSVQIDDYFTAVYPEGSLDFSGDYSFVPDPETKRRLEESKKQAGLAPVVESLDQSVKEAVAGTEELHDILTLISDHFALGDGRDQTVLENYDRLLNETIQRVNEKYFAMAEELKIIRAERNRQLMQRYESAGQSLAAEAMRAIRFLDAFSDDLDYYLDGQRIELAAFDSNRTALQASRDQLAELANDPNQLTYLQIKTDDLDEGLAFISQIEPILETFRQAIANAKPLEQATVDQFDEAYYGFLDYFEMRLP